MRGLLGLEYPDCRGDRRRRRLDRQTRGHRRASTAFAVITHREPGLSSAPQHGRRGGDGEIVAYLDDDACRTRTGSSTSRTRSRTTDTPAVGGPNIPPDGDGRRRLRRQRAGRADHVLLTDTRAEHIPGCNMAFRRRRASRRSAASTRSSARPATTSTSAGGCRSAAGRSASTRPRWSGTTAVTRVRAYWRQQRGYGRAEALLERKWPEKYNAAGHVTWAGRIYGPGARLAGWRPQARLPRQLGQRPVPARLPAAPATARSLPLMPEWYLVLGALGGLRPGPRGRRCSSARASSSSRWAP